MCVTLRFFIEIESVDTRMVIDIEIGGKQIWKQAVSIELESLLLWKKKKGSSKYQ